MTLETPAKFHLQGDMSKKGEFIAGLKATFPLVVGGVPFGIIFGAVAATSGISPQGAMGMSLFVFAGSAQFIATGLVASGVGIGFIVLTTFVVNLRHALYGATLGPHVKHLPQKWLLPLGFLLTDETFIVTAMHYEKKDGSPNKHWFFLASSIFMYISWQLSTLIGIVAGQAIPEPITWGLDFAMSATFIGMLIPLIRGRPIMISVLVAGVTAVLANGLPNQLGLIVAALAGIASGVIAEYLLAKNKEAL